MIQFRAQCGVFSPTEICLLWGLLHWSQGRKVCMTLVIYLKTPVSFSQEKINQNHKKEGKRCHFPPSEEMLCYVSCCKELGRNCFLCCSMIGEMYHFFRGSQNTLQAFTIPVAAHRDLLRKLPKFRLCLCCQSSAALSWQTLHLYFLFSG